MLSALRGESAARDPIIPSKNFGVRPFIFNRYLTIFFIYPTKTLGSVLK